MGLMLRAAALWTGCLILAVRPFAQQHAFMQITPRDGLAQSQVRSMAQDGAGYLWLGTLGGASRFDGHSFVNYSLQQGLPDAHVSAMVAGADGTMWLAAGPELLKVQGGRMRSMGQQVPMGGRILTLASAADGSIILGTDHGTVLRHHEGRSEQVPGILPEALGAVRALLPLTDGTLWVGAEEALLRCADGACHVVEEGSMAPASISGLARDEKGSIWVATFGEGVYRVDPGGAITNFDEEHGLLQSNVRCVLVDEQGRVWFGSKFGLNMFEEGRMRSFTIYQGLPSDNIWCAFQDREGNLWFGTDGSGALRYAGDAFVTFTVTDGLCSDLVMTMVADADGDLWLGTYGSGICRADGMAMVTTVDGLPNNTVWSSLRDRHGRLWFGTSDGLAVMERGEVLSLPSTSALRGHRVLALHEDTRGNIWCGTREGLAMLAPDGVLTHHVEPGPGRSVRSIFSGPDGTLWMGTEQGVVAMRDGGFEPFPIMAGTAPVPVLCLLFDASGRLWAGTTNGLAWLDGDAMRHVGLGPDLGSNYIDLLLQDKSGRVWAGTNNGLFSFDPDVFVGDPEAHEHIGANEGLRSLECNLNAAYMDARGRLFFGTAAGLVLHDPGKLHRPAGAMPPVVHITGLRSFLKETDWSPYSTGLDAKTLLPAGLELPHGRHHLTFDYTGISFAAPGRLRYRYRLRGMDEDWLPLTSDRSATYSNLPPGEHVFEVMAMGGGGAWSEPARFHFRVEPPFWTKPWFFFLVALAVAGLVWLVMRYRQRIRARRERTRQLMLRSRMLQLEQQALNANMNRHFVFNALNSIQSYINRQDRATANKYLSSFARLIRKNLDASQSDTTTLAEELQRLELYLVLEHMRFKDRFRYGFVVGEGVQVERVRLPAMMLQPYVENAIWHGILPMERQGCVTVEVLLLDHGHVRVRITDDGVGVEQSMSRKDRDADHISRGIEITKGRADVLRKLDLADIRIFGPRQLHDGNGAPCGTEVLIDLPLDEKASGIGAQDLITPLESITFDR